MRCPICQLEMVNEDFGNSDIWVCKAGCNGIWITYQDLIRLGEKNEGFGVALDEALNAPAVHDRERGQIVCPKCRVPMHIHKYKSVPHVIVDECYECGGFFLDPGELKLIREVFRSKKEKKRYVQYLLADLPEYHQMQFDSAKLENRANAIKKFTEFRYFYTPFVPFPWCFFRIPSSSGRANIAFDDTDAPDTLEKGIRLGCGGLVGLLFGLIIASRMFSDSIAVRLITVIIIAGVCAIVALKTGDRFWNALKH